jgi:hypothetical protein
MVPRNRKRHVYLSPILITMFALLTITFSPSTMQAAPLVLPPRPIPGLPPRPTPVLPPASTSSSRSQESVGGYIDLYIPSAPAELWTVVQWQDSLGNWHDVEGWRGTPDEGHNKVWWVARADFGKGPFRWVIYENQEGELLAKSETFYLPDSAGKTVRVEVSLMP